MTIEFVPATRDAVYSRTCVYGPGGSGKTLTGLMALHTLCNGERFAVIDTERGRAKKYVGANPWKLNWQFDSFTPHSFDPATLTEALGVAAGNGYPGIMIDSGSQYWNGVDGMQEQVDRKTAAAGRKDSYSSGWKDMAPIERRMWDAVMNYPGHVWMTLRVKTAYVVEEKERNGRTISVPRKVGLKPVQRDGFEYEFDLVIEADQDNTFTVTKSDILLIPQGTVIPKPGPEFAEALGDFCSEGIMATGPMAYRSQALDKNATREDLLDLLETVKRAGLVNAPVTDEFNQPTVLGDLVIARGRAVKAAADEAHRTRPAASEQPAPAPLVTAPQVAADVATRPASKGQLQNLNVELGNLGVTNRNNKIAIISELTGRPLTSSGELTMAEAGDLIKKFKQWVEAGNADALIAELLANPQVMRQAAVA
jgi:hypothetical protein